MPFPGKSTTPVRPAATIMSLRLKGAALRCLAKSGLKTILGDAARFGPGGGRDFGAVRSASSKVPTGGGPGRPVSLSGLHGLLDCT